MTSIVYRIDRRTYSSNSLILPRPSVGPADLQTVFDPKAAMAAFEILRLQPPRGAQ
eukprot:COSAG01_NODE_74072_length_229_cov_3.053846_2_plen_55_part_01